MSDITERILNYDPNSNDMKVYQFQIEITKTGHGEVTARNRDEARKKIENEDWDDIFDETDEEYGDILTIEYDRDVE